MKVLVCFLAIAALSYAEFLPKELTAPVYKLPAHFGSRIVGGDEVVPHSVPYQVALFINTPQGQFFCGGSIISENYVLTAAHCCDSASEVEVVMGAHRVRDNESTQVRVKVPKSNIHVHERWNPNTLSNDLTLLKMPSPIEFNDNIQAVKLIGDDAGSLAGEMETTTGWGKDSDNAGGISLVLRTVSTPILSNSECSDFFGSVITSSIICGNGKGGKSSCNGDSGGPMVIGQGADRQQIGIVSFGSAFGCEIGYPHAYTRVSSFLDWIRKNSDVKF